LEGDVRGVGTVLNCRQLRATLDGYTALVKGCGEHGFDVRLPHQCQVRKRGVTQREIGEAHPDDAPANMQVRLGEHVRPIKE
jgi:hypothetical protein